MSEEETLLVDLPIELGVYDNNDSFNRLKNLVRPFDRKEDLCGVQIEMMEAALEVMIQAASKEEQDEAMRIISTRDPIMWHLLCVNTNIDVNQELPQTFLKKFILFLRADNGKIKREYADIISPKMWDKPLKSEYKEFQEFVDEHYLPEYLFNTMSFIIIPLALILIFIGSLAFIIKILIPMLEWMFG